MKLEEGGLEGYPSEVRIFAGWRKGAQMWAVRGSGVEGGPRGVPGGRPAKKNHHAIYKKSAKTEKRPV